MSLSSHVISSIDAVTISSRYPRTVGRNSFRPSHGSGAAHPVVVLRTNHGAMGWGLPLQGSWDAQQILGRNVAELIDPASGVLVPTALSLDYPLHDLAAKILDLPVHAMLGAAGGRSTSCYSGAIYFDDLDAVPPATGLDIIGANLASDFEQGFRAFKLKLGRGYRWMPHDEGLRRDIEVTQYTRTLYPDADILVDANDGFTLNTLAEYLAGVADVPLFWIEEPFAERREDLHQLRGLLAATHASTRIADGEYEPQLAKVLSLAADKLLDVALMDVIGFGLTAWRRVMPELVNLGVQASPHAWGLPLKTLYAAQIAAGLGNVLTVEGVPGTTTGADTSGYRLEEGRLTVPDAAGFGIPLTAYRPTG
nr:enolase C-terminal domain-like protein [uncultured Friedmanniella sp.]